MSQIILITRFGKKECTPFQVNEAPNNFEQEEDNSITEGQDGANKDTKATVGEQDAVSPASADNN